MQLAIRGIAVTIADTEVARIVDSYFNAHPLIALPVTVSAADVSRIVGDHLSNRDAPRIGEPYAGGTYAGLTLHDNAPMHLVLLDGEAEDLTWAKAKDWANGLEDNAELPTRIDALVLFTNLRDKFQKTYYWTAAPTEPGSAWCQGFTYGDLYWYYVNLKLRARAVRRLPI